MMSEPIDYRELFGAEAWDKAIEADIPAPGEKRQWQRPMDRMLVAFLDSLVESLHIEYRDARPIGDVLDGKPLHRQQRLVGEWRPT